MHKLYLSLVCSLMAAILIGQNDWSWGLSLQTGYSGERVNENYDYGRPGSFIGQRTTERIPELSAAAGLWLGYQLAPRWQIQAGMQYRHLVTAKRTVDQTFTAANAPRSYSNQRIDLQQQSIEMPFSLRYYLAHPVRAFRPYIGAQLAPAYLLAGRELQVERSWSFFNPVQETVAYEYLLDFSDDYVRTQPWQATYGFQLGVEWKQFALSLVHNRTFRAAQLDYDQDLLAYIDVVFIDPADYANFQYNPYYQTRILRNTNLQLQYTF